jgi:predicted transcriptional regulator YheO
MIRTGLRRWNRRPRCWRASPHPRRPRPEALFEQDWTERVHEIIGSFVRTRGRPVERLGREGRLAVLAELHHAGVFAVRRAVPMVAAALKASRSTVYALLADLKAQRSDT